MIDFWLAKYPHYQEFGPKKYYIDKLQKWQTDQNLINFELFFGTFTIEEDQTYSFNLVGQNIPDQKQSKKKKK